MLRQEIMISEIEVKMIERLLLLNHFYFRVNISIEALLYDTIYTY